MSIATFFIIKQDSTPSLFKHHISNPIPTSVNNIKHEKNRLSIHGPFIFSFNVNNQDLEKIIKTNELIKYEEIPKNIDTLLNQFENVSWWKSSNELNKMTIYGKIVEKEYEWNIFFLFTNIDGIVYIIKM